MCRVWSWYPVILEPLYLYCERTGPGLLGGAGELSGVALPSCWLPGRSGGWPRRRGCCACMAGLRSCCVRGPLPVHTLPSCGGAGGQSGADPGFDPGLFLCGPTAISWGCAPAMAVVCALLILPFAAVSLPLIGLMPRRCELGRLSGRCRSCFLAMRQCCAPSMPATARGLLVAALIMLSADHPALDRPAALRGLALRHAFPLDHGRRALVVATGAGLPAARRGRARRACRAGRGPLNGAGQSRKMKLGSAHVDRHRYRAQGRQAGPDPGGGRGAARAGRAAFRHPDLHGTAERGRCRPAWSRWSASPRCG